MSDKKQERGGVVLYLLLVFGVVAIAFAGHLVAKNFNLVAGVVFLVTTLGWAVLGIVLFRRGEQDEYIDVSSDEPPVESASRAAQPAVLRARAVEAPPPISRPPVLPVEADGFAMPVVKPKKPPPPPPEPPKVCPIPPMSREERYRAFQEADFRESIATGVKDLTLLIEGTRGKLHRYQHVMDKRMHKTTGTEHKSLLSAKHLLELLEERRKSLNQALIDFESGKADRDTVFGLLYDNLEPTPDSGMTLADAHCSQPIPREQWEPVLDLLCRQVARKPSFLQLLRDDLMRRVPGSSNSSR